MNNLPQDQKIDVRILERVLSDQYITLSYKLFWFRSIVGFVVRGKATLTFEEIVNDMIASAWYMVSEYKLNLGYKDTLQKLILFMTQKYKIPSNESKSKIIKFLEDTDDREIIEMRKTLYNFVPYRLITPFYEVELRELTNRNDRLTNLTIMELSYSDEKVLYSFSTQRETIIVNDKWVEYIITNQLIVKGWLNYKLINYLQKKNPNVPAIPFKLEAPKARSLSAATKYWNEVGKVMEIPDIYTGETINAENIRRFGSMSIDHFIPWSFTLHDEIWNLLPCFKNINSAKSNRLPNMERYFDSFCSLQYRALQIAGDNTSFRNLMEDYINIYSKKIDFSEAFSNRISKKEFSDCLKDTIYPLHQIAYNQGFEIWEAN